MKAKKSTLFLDVNNGFFVKNSGHKKRIKHMAVAVGTFKELKRQADLLNIQFEKI